MMPIAFNLRFYNRAHTRGIAVPLDPVGVRTTGPLPDRPTGGLASRLAGHSGSTRPSRAPGTSFFRHSSRLPGSGRAPPASTVARPSSPRRTGRAGPFPPAGLRPGAASISDSLPARARVPSHYPSQQLRFAFRPPVPSVTPRAACAAGASSVPGAVRAVAGDRAKGHARGLRLLRPPSCPLPPGGRCGSGAGWTFFNVPPCGLSPR